MMHNMSGLYDQLRANLVEIELQIKHIKNDIALEYKPEERDKINVWYWTYRSDGKPVLMDLLVAKAQILSGMAALKAADVTSKAPAAKRGTW